MDQATIVLSLNEAETLATKAARGAGLSWGEAEDLGRGARWLAARGLDWAGPLLGLAEQPGGTRRPHAPAEGRRPDRRTFAPTAEISIEACRPVWVLAILASMARSKTSLDLRGPDFGFRVSPEGVASSDRAEPATSAARPQPRIAVEASADALPLARVLAPNMRRSTVSARRMDELGGLAARTYVPASADSRRLGAGGSRIDDA